MPSISLEGILDSRSLSQHSFYPRRRIVTPRSLTFVLFGYCILSFTLCCELARSFPPLEGRGAQSETSIYGGDALLDHPPHELCLAQAAMNYAAPPMAVVAGFEVVLQVSIRVTIWCPWHATNIPNRFGARLLSHGRKPGLRAFHPGPSWS